MSTHHQDHDAAPERSETQQQIAGLLHNPALRALIALLAAVLLFWLGTRIGGAVHDAFDGDTRAAISFGAIILLAPAGLIALGVAGDRWLNTRR